MTDPLAVTAALYRLVRSLSLLNHDTPRRELPANGVYLFFERGETIHSDGQVEDRIVRVGTHRKDGRFAARIRQHYGRLHSLRGSKNSSVFRKHLGAALMRRENRADPRLGPWLAQGGPSFPDIEESVSRLLRDSFTFVYIRVDGQQDRLNLESGLIALLAKYPVGQPSERWLGRHAASEQIRRSGLWNTQRLDASPLSAEEFQRLKQLVHTTLGQDET